MYTEEARRARGDPQAFLVQRHKQLDLEFEGWELGRGEAGWGPGKNLPREQWTHVTTVRMYLTAGGRWVAVLERQKPGKMNSESTVTENPEEVFKWLTRETYGAATRQAWEATRATLPSLPALERERIE